jgi:DNA invertase Pin-like site-specific DNA recombinase
VDTRRHYGYIRVSTKEQAESGLGLAAQETKIRAHMAAYDREIEEIVVDNGVSASTLVRPGVARLLALIAEGRVASVTIAKLDRLTRSTRDLADLLDLVKKYDVDLISVGESLDTSTASGRMVVSLLGVVAQWERETISERTKAALAERKARGLALGTNLTAETQALGRAALAERAAAEREAFRPKVVALQRKGLSRNQIAATLGKSTSFVGRVASGQ